MKGICLYFQVHQPYRLNQFQFFDIGSHQNYFDEGLNKDIVRKVAMNCYLPANKLLLRLIEEYKGKFKVNLSLSGSVIEQFERYVPEVINSFQQLAATGCIEFLAETYYHSLASFDNKSEFVQQVKQHHEKIKTCFGQSPGVFRNTELIYADEIGHTIAGLGYKGMLLDGVSTILHGRSPNQLFAHPIKPNFKLFLKNSPLSDDLAFRFSDKDWSEWPLNPYKYAEWIKAAACKGDIVNLFMDYETFGEHQSAATGIFDFFYGFSELLLQQEELKFYNLTEAVDSLPATDKLEVPVPVSWADWERDLSAWLGNTMQQEAYQSLNELELLVRLCKSPLLTGEWRRLQQSDHFYYMSTKGMSDGEVHAYFSHYDSPYEAFSNYMNVVADFKLKLERYIQTVRNQRFFEKHSMTANVN